MDLEPYSINNKRVLSHIKEAIAYGSVHNVDTISTRFNYFHSLKTRSNQYGRLKTYKLNQSSMCLNYESILTNHELIISMI